VGVRCARLLGRVVIRDVRHLVTAHGIRGGRECKTAPARSNTGGCYYQNTNAGIYVVDPADAVRKERGRVGVGAGGT
jgi:hypothetical protein